MATATDFGALLLLLATTLPALSAADEVAEAAAVRASVDAFFDAMSEHDAVAITELVVAEGVAATVRDDRRDDARPDLRLIPLAELPQIFAANTDAIRERIWDAEIRIDSNIATLWAPYDFWHNGEFDHCGVDAFQLLKLDGRWRIFSIVWTSRHDNCPPGPLGTLRE